MKSLFFTLLVLGFGQSSEVRRTPWDAGVYQPCQPRLLRVYSGKKIYIEMLVPTNGEAYMPLNPAIKVDITKVEVACFPDTKGESK